MTGPATLLREFYQERLDALLRHEAGAKYVSQYDANNTYQYIINREETHLTWLGKAITELGESLPQGTAASDRAPAKRETARRITDEDSRDVQAFIDRWRPRVEAVTNARHRQMLRVILGELLEQKRFFDQASAGRTDLLGTRSEQVGARVGAVLPTRWIE
jgi:hypothetical protein